MASLKERLLSIEQDFLSSLVHGEDAISAFNDRWDALADDLSFAVDSAALDSETSLLAHTTATRLATLADTSVELFNNYNTITSQLMEEVDSMMSNLSLDDYDSLYQASGPSTRLSRSHSKSHSPDSPDAVSSSGRKRRTASPSEDVAPENQRKRRRSSEQSTVRICGDTNPSRPSKHSREPQISHESQQATTSIHLSLSYDDKPTSLPSRSSRKRCLSETDASIAPLPRKRFHPGPRLHAVSDTFVAHQVPSPMLQSKTRQQPVVDSSPPLDLTIPQSPTAELMVPCQLDIPSDTLIQCHLGTTDALSSEFNSLLESLFDPPALSAPYTPSPSSYSVAPLFHHPIVDACCATSDSVSTAPSSPQSNFSSVSPATPPPTYVPRGANMATPCEYFPNAVSASPSWLPIPTSEESNILSIAPAKYPTSPSSLGEQVTTCNKDNCWTSWFDFMESHISLSMSPPPYLSDLGLNVSPSREDNGPHVKGFEPLGFDNGLVDVALTEGCMA